eukprot:364440-Chlamydomonas_euryale.AAC.5
MRASSAITTAADPPPPSGTADRKKLRKLGAQHRAQRGRGRPPTPLSSDAHTHPYTTLRGGAHCLGPCRDVNACEAGRDISALAARSGLAVGGVGAPTWHRGQPSSARRAAHVHPSRRTAPAPQVRTVLLRATGADALRAACGGTRAARRGGGRAALASAVGTGGRRRTCMCTKTQGSSQATSRCAWRYLLNSTGKSAAPPLLATKPSRACSAPQSCKDPEPCNTNAALDNRDLVPGQSGHLCGTDVAAGVAVLCQACPSESTAAGSGHVPLSPTEAQQAI